MIACASKIVPRDRINLWDFDDTLAYSLAAVSEMARAHPEVPYTDWWHDPERSTEAILRTKPVHHAWRLLSELPGEHWILTARNGDAVRAWLECFGRLHHFERVVSTSHQLVKRIPAAQKKTLVIAQALALAREVYFFDDSPRNILAARRVCPDVQAITVVAPMR